jgi:hypothetical protein
LVVFHLKRLGKAVGSGLTGSLSYHLLPTVRNPSRPASLVPANAKAQRERNALIAVRSGIADCVHAVRHRHEIWGKRETEFISAKDLAGVAALALVRRTHAMTTTGYVANLRSKTAFRIAHDCAAKRSPVANYD